MRNFILLALCLSPLPGLAQVTDGDVPIVIESGNGEPQKRFERRASHWVLSYFFEHSKYEAPFDFVGVKRNIEEVNQDLWGLRLGFGREFFIRPGVTTATKVEAYFQGVFDSLSYKSGATEDAPQFSYYRRQSQLMGADVVQTLGYMFEMKTKNPLMEEMTYLTIEPYVLGGLGMAYAQNGANYSYNTGGTNERYKVLFTDHLVNFKLGLGVNFTSGQGHFFGLSVTQNNYKILERETYGFRRQSGEASDTSLNRIQKDLGVSEVWTYALGGGYKF